MNPSFILEKLYAHQDKKYQFFMQKLIPNCHEIMGVRMPILKKIAKEYGVISVSDLKSYQPKTHEEKMVLGLIVANSVKTPDQFDLVTAFIPYIKNWAVCDTFCTYLKSVEHYPDETLKFLELYLNSTDEFEIRFALVLLLFHFVKQEHLPFIFNLLDNFNSEFYYASMAAAWLLSVCYLKFKDETMCYLKHSQLDKITFNRSIQKILESKKTSQEDRALLKKMKY